MAKTRKKNAQDGGLYQSLYKTQQMTRAKWTGQVVLLGIALPTPSFVALCGGLLWMNERESTRPLSCCLSPAAKHKYSQAPHPHIHSNKRQQERFHKLKKEVKASLKNKNKKKLKHSFWGTGGIFVCMSRIFGLGSLMPVPSLVTVIRFQF